MLKKKKRLVDPKIDYNAITPYIYIGTNDCCQVHFNHKLVREKIKADISLEKVRIDSAYGVDYYLWLPTPDHYAPTVKQLYVGAVALDCLVKNKIRTYVHCREGHGRSPALVIAYFILKGKIYKKAFDIVKKKRPVMHLNKRQVSTLKRFEKYVR